MKRSARLPLKCPQSCLSGILLLFLQTYKAVGFFMALECECPFSSSFHFSCSTDVSPVFVSLLFAPCLTQGMERGPSFCVSVMCIPPVTRHPFIPQSPPLCLFYKRLLSHLSHFHFMDPISPHHTQIKICSLHMR